MKSFINIIVVLLCIQTIHAHCNCKESCEDQLADLRKDAAEFFTKFKQEHDIAHQDLQSIQMATSFLIFALDTFVNYNYGADFDLPTLNCILRQSLDGFNLQLNLIKPQISHLQTECDTLVEMADNFYDDHNLICKRGPLKGCEADLNNLRCDLSAFIKALRNYARKAIVDLQGIDKASYYLGNIARKLDSDYHPTCVVNENSNQTNLKRNIKGIYSEFRKRTDAGMEYLKDLAGICKNLSAAIDNWNARLA